MTIRKSLAAGVLAGTLLIGALLGGPTITQARHNPPFVPTRPTINLHAGEAVPVHCLSGKPKSKKEGGGGYLVGCV